jgi:hypoxanthine-guanine phosphoribosyltransferase
MTARIKKIGEEKAKVIVRGEFMEPISVNIFDKNDVLVYDDIIDSEKSFSKIYDLSRIEVEELRIEVVAAQKLLASTEF